MSDSEIKKKKIDTRIYSFALHYFCVARIYGDSNNARNRQVVHSHHNIAVIPNFFSRYLL